jgi:hypothetical protein
MTDTRPIILAGQTIDVPPLPLRQCIPAYKLCRKLTANDLPRRIAAASGSSECIDCSGDEIEDLVELCFLAASGANPDLTREEFYGWAVSPGELIGAFIQIRYQTGGWIPPTAEEIAAIMEGREEPGEERGAETLPT